MIAVLTEKLLELTSDDIAPEQAFAHANDVLKNAAGADIHGCGDTIHIPGLIKVEIEDVQTVMSEPGQAMMGTAVACGPDRATQAAESALASPLLQGICLGGTRGVLLLITASKAIFKLAESPTSETAAFLRKQTA